MAKVGNRQMKTLICSECKEENYRVSKNVRNSGLGQQLMEKMENYFKSIDCEYVVIDVFAYNNLAINFYNKQGYHTRGLIDIKKL